MLIVSLFRQNNQFEDGDDVMNFPLSAFYRQNDQ